MTQQVIELEVGEVLWIGDLQVTVLDIENGEVCLRIVGDEEFDVINEDAEEMAVTSRK